jgi:hypothetical protein
MDRLKDRLQRFLQPAAGYIINLALAKVTRASPFQTSRRSETALLADVAGLEFGSTRPMALLLNC